MNITTDFKQWLKGAEPDGYQEVCALHTAVKNCSTFGIYDVKPAKGSGNRWIVAELNSNEGLLLASSEAREAFLLHLLQNYCTGFDDFESWYSFMQAKEKND